MNGSSLLYPRPQIPHLSVGQGGGFSVCTKWSERRQKQGIFEIKANKGYMVKPCLKIKKKRQKKHGQQSQEFSPTASSLAGTCWPRGHIKHDASWATQKGSRDAGIGLGTTLLLRRFTEAKGCALDMWENLENYVYRHLDIAEQICNNRFGGGRGRRIRDWRPTLSPKKQEVGAGYVAWSFECWPSSPQHHINWVW